MKRWAVAVVTIGAVALAGAGCSSSSDDGAVPSAPVGTSSAAPSAGLQLGRGGVPAGVGSFKLDGTFVNGGMGFSVMCTVKPDTTSVLSVGVSVILELSRATPPAVTKFSYLPPNGVLNPDPTSFRVSRDGDATLVTGKLSGTLFTEGGGVNDVSKTFEFRYTC